MNYIFNLIGDNPFLACIVAIVVFFQFRFAFRTGGKINELENFFPDIQRFKVIRIHVSSKSLCDDKVIDRLSMKPQELDSSEGEAHSDTNEDEGESEEMHEVALIRLEGMDVYKEMSSVVYKTNRYLCKNIGTSADFPLLKDICERRLEVLESEIQNSLNTPLYLGLAGTFLGIISGLGGIDTSALVSTDGTTEMTGFQGLLGGVVVAMCASLAGLILTILNGTVLYKNANAIAVSKKDEYFDFLQRELMPTLSSSMSSSLNSLRGVLGHFVDKFGGNLDTYTDSIDTLNENISTQHEVLVELNKLSLTKTANKIAESFLSLKDASDSLDVFKQYQSDLNDTMQKTSETIGRIDTVLARFDEFGRSLQVVADNQTRTIALETEFKNAIEANFPTGSAGREIWQKSFDELVGDAKEVTRQLNSQLLASTEHIQNFVTGNKEFFSSFQQMQVVLGQLVTYSKLQAECYQDLKAEMLNLRRDNKDIQLENAELGKSILEAVRTMTSVARSINS